MKIACKPLLVTTTLVDNMDWFLKAPPSWKERAFESLRKTVTRTGDWDPSPEIMRGIKFEKQINDALIMTNTEPDFIARFPDYNSVPNLRMFFNLCFGGQQQKVLKGNIIVDDQEFFLYGKADIAFSDRIVDIKTTNSPPSAIKYLSKFQHILYMYLARVKRFDYVVAEFNEGELVDVYDYGTTMTTDQINNEVEIRIRSLVEFLAQDKELLNAYINTFTR